MGFNSGFKGLTLTVKIAFLNAPVIGFVVFVVVIVVVVVVVVVVIVVVLVLVLTDVCGGGGDSRNDNQLMASILVFHIIFL